MRSKLFPIVAATMIAAASSATAASSAPATHGDQDSVGWEAQQAPGFYRFRLGDFRITVLSDGTYPLDVSTVMSEPKKVRSEMAASHQALPVELSINCYLVDTGAKKILVDTGAGELFGATSGHLVANLRAAGYGPESIDVVLLTHIHGDHSGGLSIGGRRVFPNATVYVDRRDPDYWLSTEGEANAPAYRKPMFAQAHRTVDPYVNAGRLHPFDGAVELFPGVRSITEYGHTPGLSGYMIESRGQRLLLWGDIVHAAEVQFRDPNITIEYDVDPRAARATRKRIFADAAQQGYLVGADHISFPGVGHVRAEQSGFSWVPVPYSVILREVPHR
jgi:glyoxylase-like metal-dependent hydrolase (beta-lactamase superfamily II)